jgi:hypothetical protein
MDNETLQRMKEIATAADQHNQNARKIVERWLPPCNLVAPIRPQDIIES